MLLVEFLPAVDLRRLQRASERLCDLREAPGEEHVSAVRVRVASVSM